MRTTALEFLAECCGGEIIGNKKQDICNVKIDSREAGASDLFVCVVGEFNNGHDYAESAYQSGCRAFLMSDPFAAEDMVNAHHDAGVVLTEDTVKALEAMGSGYLNQFDLKKVAVTGSVGKTTTKMLTAAVIGSKYKTVCTQKNLNTYLGCALTCFLADETTQAIVFEMGMDGEGQIREYVSYIKPEIAIITNIGVSHMERLGSRDAIADAKLEITESFKDGDTLIVNADSDYLHTETEIRDRAKGKSCYNIKSVIAPKDYNDKGLDGVEFSYGGNRYYVPLVGGHNVINACLAITAGELLGVDPKSAAKGLLEAVSTERRLRPEKVGGITLLDDSYNASPDSMIAGITALATAEGKRKVAILSDMYELGDAEEEGHYEVGRCVGENDIDILIAVGENSSLYSQGVSSVRKTKCSVIELGTNSGASELALQLLTDGDVVLVKGSNGTHISEVAEEIRKAK